MNYPAQSHETTTETEYRVHSYQGVIHYGASLKEARAAYKKEVADTGMGMITKKMTTIIKLESWDHVQGSI